MTLLAEDGDTDAARGDVDQQFTELYAEYWPRIRRYIASRMDRGQAHLAEDLAQEVFIDFWRDYLLPGKEVFGPFALLCGMAKFRLLTHLSKKKNNEKALDFADPINAPIVATGHAYAHESPELSLSSRALEAAMEQMATASQTWRDANKKWHRLRTQLANESSANKGGLTAATRQRMTQELEAVDTGEVAALRDFRLICQQVGQLRAEVEAVGGGNWSSSSGMPASAGTRPCLAGSRSDPTVTHCPKGHPLDRANTYFHSDGDRECRSCKSSRTAISQAGRRSPVRATGGRSLTDTIPAEVLQQARDMLADPGYLHLPITQIAKQCGMAQSTLNLRLGSDVASLRRVAREKRLAQTESPALVSA
ncbi:sigma-70 family RNA polymerase sigma factor (plasmid) [Streptomyces sp. NBC_01259]|uniref:RNA polymerase sigma factor n=1 Tax=Streptomyces sp. NBC_01259 TaxID=2903800 RepID=UPI002F912E25